MSLPDRVPRPAHEALRGDPAITRQDTLVGLDFDGTLAPIVDDPEQAYADPAAVAALGRLGRAGGRSR